MYPKGSKKVIDIGDFDRLSRDCFAYKIGLAVVFLAVWFALGWVYWQEWKSQSGPPPGET